MIKEIKCECGNDIVCKTQKVFDDYIIDHNITLLSKNREGEIAVYNVKQCDAYD